MARKTRRVEAFIDQDGKGRYHVRGANGRVVNGSLSSRQYANRSSARRAASTKYPDLPLVSV